MCTSSSSNNSLLAIHSTKTDSLERKRVSLSTKRTSDTDSTGENENDNSQKFYLFMSQYLIENLQLSPQLNFIRIYKKKSQ